MARQRLSRRAVLKSLGLGLGALPLHAHRHQPRSHRDRAQASGDRLPTVEEYQPNQ